MATMTQKERDALRALGARSAVKSPAPRTLAATPTTTQAAAPSYTKVPLPSGQTVYVDTQGNFFDGSGKAVTNQAVEQNTASVQTDPFQPMLEELKSYLDKLAASGKVLNPNIQLTPEKIAEFTSQAEQEINPYYASQLKLARSELLRTAGYSDNEIQRREAQAQRKYQDSLRTLGESAAEKGFAQSGIRQRDEANLATDTQYDLDTARNQFGNSASGVAAKYAAQYGSDQLPSFQTTTAPRVLAGQPNFQSGQSANLYQISPETYDGLIGSDEFARRSNVSSRASQLEGAYRTTQASAQARQLNLGT